MLAEPPIIVEPYEPVDDPQNPNLVFLIDHQADRIVALQGGARSGKTYSALQFLIGLAFYYSGLVISIVRESFPVLRGTVLKDFKDILMDAGLYDEENEAKPNGYYEYTLNGNTFEFFSADNQQKLRGRKRHILYINEANELTLYKFRQLLMRTEGLCVIDYNPSEPESYIYDHVLTRNDCHLLITTYKDNPHLPQAIVEEIELLMDTDEEYWKVFGLGMRGNVSGIIYSHYKVLGDAEWPYGKGVRLYGLDFGYSNPSALIEIIIYDNAVYARQIIYRRKLTNTALIALCNELGISKTDDMWCDSAEPDRIKEFNDAGYNAKAADKTIKAGLDSVRAHPLNIHEGSHETLTEVKGYRYKKNAITQENTEEPVAIADHAMDGIRYPVFNYFKQGQSMGATARRPAGKKPMSL